ncbi:hypothetical protein [Paenibacillus thermotolerans]|uniref:hypothetical protein n=1 Tax=Paenibacillus thermotolerans TaxID=3027807 RepID=UPI002368B9CF|nr:MULTISPECIES: hypothetical protein [unclassified Paenibacillus]
MITDEQLDAYRIEGTLLRVVRDASKDNDVRGYVVAWDDNSVLIRKRTRKLVKLDRRYVYQPYTEPRALPPAIKDAVLEDAGPEDV